MHNSSRRRFLGKSLGLAAALAAGGPLTQAWAQGAAGSKMKIGLVTYLWGEHWDVPTLIENCTQSGLLGVELRTTHKHGVERDLTSVQREEVKKRFEDSPVTFVGIGSNENFDHTSPRPLARAIQATKDFVVLSKDVGGSGVKVKPNSFHDGVSQEQTIEQIGTSLNTLGAFAADHGQQIRLEVHGGCSELPTIKQIMDIADHPSVAVCWNSNDEDLKGEGLEHNFNLVKDRFGATAHIRELNVGDYPYQQLMNLFVGMDYEGWILLEARTKPKDPVAAMIEQREIFEKMVAGA